MSAQETFRVFVSAVSNELAGFRREVARVLRRKGLEACDQDHFHQGPGTLLEKLRDYIQKCDVVVLLVGDQCGAVPTHEHVKALGPIPGYDAFRADSKQTFASYTQWEYLLAKHYSKPTLVFFTDAKNGYKPENPSKDDAAQTASQAAYRAWIHHRGEHREAIVTADQLKEDLLVNPLLPTLHHRKRIHLPHLSLGTLFKGRDDILKKLRDDFSSDRPGVATAITGKAVHGLGGVGKTRLAIEFAWRNELDYNALLFVTADSPEALQVSIANLVGPMVLNLPEKDAREMDVRMKAVLDWLQDHPGWFLIIDNVDKPESAQAVQSLLAQLHGGQVLITSRLGHWRGMVKPLALDVLAPEDAAAYLKEATEPPCIDPGRTTTPTDAADALRLAKALGGLALALEQAAGYIAELRVTFADYLTKWNAHDQTVQTWHDPLVMQYPRPVATTWQTTIDQLGAAEFALLRLLAYYAPDPLPLSVFGTEKAVAHWKGAIELLCDEIPRLRPIANASTQSSPHAPREELVTRSVTTTLADVQKAVHMLARYNMADWDAPAKTIEVHRVVQEILRNRVPEADRVAWTLASLKLLDDAFVGDPTDVRSWPVLNPLAAHAEEVTRHADEVKITDPTSRLMNQLGLLFKQQIRFSDAENLYRRAIANDEKNFGAEHPNVAIRLNNLAALLHVTNRLSEAEPMMRRALAIDEKSFGTEHPKFANRLNNLAQLLQDTNRLSEAEPMMARVVSIFEKALGPDHPQVAVALNNLAQLLKATNRLSDAEPLMHRALAIDEKSFGPEHPNVGRDLNNLAQLLQDTNRLSEAEPMMRRAVAIVAASLGVAHPTTQTAKRNYVALLKAMGRSDAEVRAQLDAIAGPLGVSLEP